MTNYAWVARVRDKKYCSQSPRKCALFVSFLQGAAIGGEEKKARLVVGKFPTLTSLPNLCPHKKYGRPTEEKGTEKRESLFVARSHQGVRKHLVVVYVKL